VWIIAVIEEIFATIRHHPLPGHIARLFTGQRDGQQGNLFWLAPAGDRVPGAGRDGQSPVGLLTLDAPGPIQLAVMLYWPYSRTTPLVSLTVPSPVDPASVLVL
jgi:hypothetical protein